MVADNFQPQVEDGICKHRYLYHFNDYLQAVNLCEDAIEMTHEDFSDFRNYKNNVCIKEPNPQRKFSLSLFLHSSFKLDCGFSNLEDLCQ